MRAAIVSSWPVFATVGLMMVGNGLLVTQLGVRAPLSGFPTVATGLVMSAYFVGQLVGSLLAPRLVIRVGHVRVFAAVAALATAAPLVHALFVDPFAWAAMRFVSGVCFAGLYVTAETWLNDRASNANRGRLLSLYMAIQLAGLGCGQLLSGGAGTAGDTPFLVVSLLISVATLPILLTVSTAPVIQAPQTMGPRRLFRAAPLAVVGCAGMGVAHGAFFGMGATWAEGAGLGSEGAALFMSSATAGAVVLMIPLGWVSDRFDRRLVLAAQAVAAGAAALATALAVTRGGSTLFLLVALFGGFTAALYPLLSAIANDRLAPQQIVAAGGTLMLLYGSGAAFGPMVASAAMELAPVSGLLVLEAGLHGAIGTYAVWRAARMGRSPATARVPAPERL